MNNLILNHHIEQFRQRMGELLNYPSAMRSPHGEPLLHEALEELQVALEEVQQGQEELQRQNTELAAARESALTDRRRYQNLFEYAPDAYLITDPNGTVHQANRAAGGLLGVLPHFLVQKPLMVFIAPEDQRNFLARLNELLAGHDMLDWEMNVHPRGGLPVQVSARAMAVRSDGRFVELRWLLRDISMLRQARLQALQAERLAAIGQMVTGLAHESGNALQRSQACLEMLVPHLQDCPRGLVLLTRALEAQNDLRQLYESVRDYAAPIVLQRKTSDLGRIVETAWNYLAINRHGRDARLEAQAAGLDLGCNGDPVALRRVFRNILNNALAACTDPVRIEVQWVRAELEGHSVLRAVVHDNGPGLTREQRERIFEPFYTTKTHGTGLGMAIARRIVEAHGGQLEVGDPSGPGAEFVVTLPREEPC